MRMMTSDTFDRWAKALGLVALVALVWAVVVPDGIFWTAILAAGLMGAAVATTLLVRSRQVPTLAQVIASATAEPALVLVPSPAGYTNAAGLRPHRRRKVMKVRPLHDRMLVRRIEEKETAKGGIIIPDTAKEKPMQGKVLAVGNGRVLENGKKVALDVKVGDRVLFGKYSGTEIKIDGEEVVIVREDEVLAVMG